MLPYGSECPWQSEHPQLQRRLSNIGLLFQPSTDHHLGSLRNTSIAARLTDFLGNFSKSGIVESRNSDRINGQNESFSLDQLIK